MDFTTHLKKVCKANAVTQTDIASKFAITRQQLATRATRIDNYAKFWNDVDSEIFGGKLLVKPFNSIKFQTNTNPEDMKKPEIDGEVIQEINSQLKQLNQENESLLKENAELKERLEKNWDENSNDVTITFANEQQAQYVKALLEEAVESKLFEKSGDVVGFMLDIFQNKGGLIAGEGFIPKSNVKYNEL